jgi:predicted Zn-dependent protease
MNGAQQPFQGGVFSAELTGGRAGAEVSFTSHAVVATTPDGQLFSLAFASMQLELGGAAGKTWFCRSTDRALTIFCDAAGFGVALRQAGGRVLGDKLEQLEQTARRASRRGWLWASALSAALVLLLVAGVLALRAAGRLALEALPVDVDRQLGQLALEHMELGGSPSSDEVLQRAVRLVMQRLEQAEPSGFTFAPRVLQASTVNAFALPGGPIVIYTGLLREAESADQLAGVLAHEMAHVTRRHGLTRIAQSVGVVAAVQLLFGDLSGVAAIAVEVLREGAINSYSRVQEHEADMDAVERLRKARLDPLALADFFALLEKREDALPGIGWLGTHPELAQRVKDVRQRAARAPLPSREPLNIDWSDVRRRAGQTSQ